MPTITELKRQIKGLQKKQTELTRQECALQDEIFELERDKWADKVRKHIHAGDVRMINNDITGYHCDALKIYEILEVSEHTNKCKRNGVPSTYTSFCVKVRTFTIHVYDGDRISTIETKQCSDIDTLLKAKKISKEEFEDFKATLMLNPTSYDGSKWDPNREDESE